MAAQQPVDGRILTRYPNSMRGLLALPLLALPLAAAPKPLPSHVTLVRPALPAPKPVLRNLILPPSAVPERPATLTACSSIVIVPADPGLDANIIRHQPLPVHPMPVYAGRPACR